MIGEAGNIESLIPNRGIRSSIHWLSTHVIPDSAILDSMILDSVILDSVILDSVILDSVILDSAILDSVIPGLGILDQGLGIRLSSPRIHQRRSVFHPDVADDRDGAAGSCGFMAGGGRRIEQFAEQTHLVDLRGNGHRDLFVAERCDRLHAAGSGTTGDALVQVLRAAELALHRASIQQISLHRQRRHDRGVFRVAAPGAHVLVGIRVTVVQVEHEGRGTGVRRDRHDDTLGGLAASEDEAVGRAGPDTDAKRLRTFQLRRLDLRRRRRRRLARRRSPPLSRSRVVAGEEQCADQQYTSRASHVQAFLISVRNSDRVRASVRNEPSIALVTATEFCFSTPRIDMHKCVASVTTPTPSGLIFSRSVLAIWFVSRSCTCRRRAKMSTRRAILLRPTTLPFGMYATWHLPKNGSMWCSHRL